MNILLITSGFQGVYSFFEQRIAGALQKAGHHCASFQPGSVQSVFRLKQQLRQPDFILLMAGVRIPQAVLEFIRQSGVKSAVWMTEDPYYMDWTAPIAGYFNYIFTIEEAALEQYKALGHPRVYHLPLGTDPALFCPSPVSTEFESDVCLVGVPYRNRIEIIDFLLADTDYHIQLVGRGWGRYVQEWSRNSGPRIGLVNAWVKPETAANYYNGAKIVLNIHRLSDERYNRNRMGVEARSINNRTYDTAACAAFQLTDYRIGLGGQFEEGTEIISYQNQQDFLQKLRYYMDHEQERRQIAEAAKQRVLAAHTFEHRIQQLLETVQD